MKLVVWLQSNIVIDFVSHYIHFNSIDNEFRWPLGILDDNVCIDNSVSKDWKPEDYPLMTNITWNFQLIGIISAFVNRSILDNVDLKNNLQPKIAKCINLSIATLSISEWNLVWMIIRMKMQWIMILWVNPINQWLIGLTTLNEQTVNWLSGELENIYDQKVRKIIEYFLRQRDYCLSIGRIKVKQNDDWRNMGRLCLIWY